MDEDMTPLVALCVLFLIISVGFFVAAIWVGGTTTDRLAGTGGISFCIAIVCAFAELIRRC